MGQKFLIAPYKTGLELDMEPWLAPAEAFTTLENVHLHHGFIEKRSGMDNFAEFTAYFTAVSDVSAATPAVATVTDTTGLTSGDKVMFLSVGGVTNINGVELYVDVTSGTTVDLYEDEDLTTPFVATGAYTSGGYLNIFPGTRIMGIAERLDSNSVKQSVIWNTTRAAVYDTTIENYVPIDTADIFTASETNYVWWANWSYAVTSASAVNNRLYFTNGLPAAGSLNGLRYWDNTGGPPTTTTLTAFDINGANTILGCKLCFVFNQRLLLLYTYEGANTYPQRMRWCQLQNPDAAESWYDNTPGKGGFADAATGDQILSARQLQDVIIVCFTNSYWIISKTSDPAQPFRWQRINDFRAIYSRNATFGFDRYIEVIGNRGLMGVDPVEARRMDEKINDFIRSYVDEDAASRVYMERDYVNQRTWILYVSSSESSEETTHALIRDTESGAFSTYTVDLPGITDNGINVLGHFTPSQDKNLQDFEEQTLQDFGDSGLQDFYWSAASDSLIGGDRQGYLYNIGVGGNDEGQSILVDILSANWNPFKDQGIQCRFNYLDILVESSQTTVFTVEFYKDDGEAPYLSQVVDCLPDMGFITQVIEVFPENPLRVNAPDHGLSTGDVIYLQGVQGPLNVNNTPYSITVLNDNFFTCDVDGTGNDPYESGGMVTLNPFQAKKTWKRVYPESSGHFHRIRITNEGINSPLIIHAFMLDMSPIGTRMIR